MKHSTRTTTLGQALQGLHAAYQKGLIAEKEYKDAQRELIKRRTE